ncbi:glycoside hydrolase family 16 protein [Neorhizobium galegae]|uniref:endo-1,3-1,4-beta-glycanase ExoK n=1 Tax=Neorhizobium galegae TaxID=399 RepID=UPI00062287E0|nr:glycoside hydrolase family 16 protein [Neorhizobium galegae]CDZ56258.1 Endo-1,3-1,4-beta-glycanase ExoK [Neorhizobium galegae bv. orientalis]KAB1123879.1 family 16 glycosylhydrolase [Neorhizobium galegae]MCQ1570742.1 glycoside hydrolase family 16 protein [Neorhizobium galegae]MCQ1806794.1 glycoside hydrolase family 16 protein [Neorhizobium galegae]UIK04578.1 glycoside hydrolase family 16 protein [Neorhizobium galegae]
MTAKARQIQLTCQVIIAAAVSGFLSPAAHAQQGAAGQSFVENFDSLDRSVWYVSDGWNNGKHQNCTWSKKQVKVEGGALQLSFTGDKTGDRDFACGEIQTKARFGYGTYEVRMKSATGSGLNSAFFTYIGPTDKKPHDEIDFEVLGKNTGQVQLNQYVSAKGNNEKLVPVAGGADQGFNDYAFIWEESRLRYFVNGKLVHEVTDKTKIPQNPQKIFLSLWGTDTLKQWMGAFSYTQPTSMTVDRISFTAIGEKCRFPESVLCTLG